MSQNPPKIWLVISNRWNSAITEYGLSAALAFRKLGFNVCVTPLVESPAEARFLSHEFEVKSVERFSPSISPRLAQIKSEISPDIIFTFGGPETTLSQFLKTKEKLIRFYGHQSSDRGPLAVLTKKLSHARVDVLVTPSEYVARSLSECFGQSVYSVDLGCDHKRFKLVPVKRDPRPKILIFGRFDPVKGHREFFPIFKQVLSLARQGSGLEPLLQVVGLPANLSEVHLKKSLSENGLLEKDVEIISSRIENVAALMSEASLGLVTSLGSELICRVAEEFLLCGTPVLTTNVGSLPEVFKDQSFGQVYLEEGVNAPEIIYQWVTKSFAESTEQRLTRSQKAQEYFSLEAMATNLNKILNSL